MKMEFQLFTGKNVEDALTKALVELGVTSDKVEYEVVEKGSNGILGIGSKPAKINVRVKEDKPIVVEEAPADIEAVIVEFLSKVFDRYTGLVFTILAVKSPLKLG